MLVGPGLWHPHLPQEKVRCSLDHPPGLPQECLLPLPAGWASEVPALAGCQEHISVGAQWALPVLLSWAFHTQCEQPAHSPAGPRRGSGKQQLLPFPEHLWPAPCGAFVRTAALRGRAVGTPTLQGRALRLREVDHCPRGDTAGGQQSWDLRPGLSDCTAGALPAALTVPV